MYEVETKFTYGWENVWMDDDKPVVFRTKKDAQAELKDNVDSWNNDPNTTSKYFYDDYRVVKGGQYQYQLRSKSHRKPPPNLS